MKKCTECQSEFNPVLAKQEFCSNKCRQKNYRRKKAEELSNLKDEFEKLKSTVKLDTFESVTKKLAHAQKERLEKMIEDVNPKGLGHKKVLLDIEKKIEAIRAEKIPKERDTPNGRRVWANDQAKRILELKNKYK